MNLFLFRIKNYIQHPKIFKLVVLEHISPLLSDKTYIKIRWNIKMNYPLNLHVPKTFNEKLQWIKLYDHNPLYTLLVDKYNVKKYVSDLIGQDHVIPIIGQWSRVDDIDWELLPNQFVIKCSHDSGGLIICKNKATLDIKQAKKTLKKCMKINYFRKSREWPYKNVKPVIFAEAYKEDEFGELRDYKWFCFNGVPKVLFVASDRQKKGEETKFDFFDTSFNHLPITNGHPNSSEIISKPKGFDTMKELASKLSQNIPEVRVDFYDINGNIYFGEFTFFHWGGMMPFKPKEWDEIFGNWINLPTNSQYSL